VGETAHVQTCVGISSTTIHSKPSVVIQESTVPNDIALSEVREVEWQSPTYHLPMRGLLVMPHNYSPQKSYPMLVDIHGGGPGAYIMLAGGILVNTPIEWQMWAAMGIVVFVPEFRSSGVFGSIAITRDILQNKSLYRADCMDIESGVNALIKDGIVSANAVVALGHSAGARITNWLCVSSTQFCGIISKEGWADEWFDTGVRKKSLIIEFMGDPALFPENYHAESCLFHIKNAKTPTLFLMGNKKKGGADSSLSVRWLHNGLKALGISSQYIYYSDEGHVFSHQENRRDSLIRTVDFVKRSFKMIDK